METIGKNILGAILDFQSKAPAIKKDSVNPHLKNKYAALEDILDTIKKPLHESGLVFMHLPNGDDSLRAILAHPASGETVEGCIPLKRSKDDAQGLGSAMTYARRYSLVAMLGLNVGGEDDDGHAARRPPQAKEQKPQDKPTPVQVADHEKGALNKLWFSLGCVFSEDAKANGNLEQVKRWIWDYCKDLGFKKFQETPKDFGKVSITENLDLPELAILNRAVDEAKKAKLPNPWMPQPEEEKGPNKPVGFDAPAAGGISIPTEGEKALMTRIGNALNDSAKDFGAKKSVVRNLFVTWLGDKFNGVDIGPVDAAFLARIPREILQAIVDLIDECAELRTYPWAHMMPSKEKSA